MSHRNTRPIKVLIVSDNHIIRSGLRRILDSQASIHVIADFNIEKASALNTIQGQQPDVVLVEVDSRGSDALRFITQQASKNNVAVLVLSDLADSDLARKALTLGAAGVVLKSQPPTVLFATIQDLYDGHNQESLPKTLAMETMPTFSKTSSSDTVGKKEIDSLTMREREIIRLVGLGLKNKDIANRLSISDITVRHHLSSIFGKLEVADRQKLLIVAHQYGLAELSIHVESN
jgi:DNA-binding NarL/FixJ family response regulator